MSTTPLDCEMLGHVQNIYKNRLQLFIIVFLSSHVVTHSFNHVFNKVVKIVPSSPVND